MPTGVRNSSEHGNNKSASRYKLSEHDETYVPLVNGQVPKNKEDGAIDSLMQDDIRRVFIQVTALNSMDAEGTYEFMRSFVLSEQQRKGFTLEVTKKLIERYSELIVKAKNVVQVYIEKSNSGLSLTKRASMVSKGLLTTEKLMDKMIGAIDSYNKANDEEGKTLGSLTRNMSMIGNQYANWNDSVSKLKIEVEEMCLALSSASHYVPGGEKEGNQDEFLLGRKLSLTLKKHGILPELADRIASVVIHGEQTAAGGVTNDEYLNDEEEEG